MDKSATRYPFSPYPSGWYSIGTVRTIVPGEITTLSYFGRELIAFRDGNNRVRVLNAYCVHLGAHLGVGGKLEDGELVCPFHGWRYNSDGRCTGIPYSEHIPDKGKLHAYPVIEWAGLVIVYFSPDDAAPGWTPDLPAFDPDEWTLHDCRHWTVRVHVQEIGENGLDMPHFKTVHSADIPQMVRAEGVGPKFHISVRPEPGSEQASFLDGIDRTLWGLGLSVNFFEGKVPSRVVIARTPVDAQLSRITVVFVPRNQGDEKTTAMFGEALMKHISREIEQDVPIWEHKAYVEQPVLTRGDGPIAAWRSWCRQFYSDAG